MSSDKKDKSLSAEQIMENLRKDYDEVAESFAKSRDRMWEEIKPLFDYAREGDEVLDLGCGNGRFSQYLEKTNYIGIDFSENLIKEAKKRFPEKKFITGNAVSLPFKENSFDKVYSIAVIHQIPSDKLREKAMLEIKRVLKEGGTAIIVVWKIQPKDYLLKKNKAQFFKDSDISSEKKPASAIIAYLSKIRKPRNMFLKRDRYYYMFSQKEISSLCKRVGFKLRETGVLKEGVRENFYVVLEK